MWLDIREECVTDKGHYLRCLWKGRKWGALKKLSYTDTRTAKQKVCCNMVCSERVGFGILSKNSVCFLLWERLFSCRALLFPQVLTHVLLWQPGWKWWYSPGSTWISIQRSFSLNYSYRTYKPELCWLSLLHLQLFVPGNGLHQPRLIFLPKCKRRNTSRQVQADVFCREK